MQGSRAVARIITIVLALVMAPAGTVLLSWGGTAWYRYYVMQATVGLRLSDLAGPMGVQILGGVGLGLLLLALAVATGLASSAGLLAVGLLGLVSVVIGAAPGLLLHAYGLLDGIVPIAVLDAMVYGLPLVLHPLIGGLGVALAIARRRPDLHPAAAVVGLLLIPMLMAIAAVVLFLGVAQGMETAMIRFDTSVRPLAAVLTVAGTALLCLAAVGVRWSPYALVLPEIALLATSALLVVPGGVAIVDPLWSRPGARSLLSFLGVGGGLGAAVVLLVATLVLAGVRRGARRRAAAIRPVDAGIAPGAGSRM